MLSMHLFLIICYATFCYLRYEECVLPSIKRIHKKYLKDLSSFAGWTIYGTACLTGSDQGISIVLNRSFGTVVNGAWGIGNQVAGYTNILSSAIVNAMRPQIVKAEGSGDRGRAIWLSNILSKLVFFLISIIGIPFIFEIDSILKVWLGNPPDNSSFFCIMFIVALLFDALTIGMTHINSAIGHIKFYTIMMNTPKLLTLGFAILFIHQSDMPVKLAIVYVAIEGICAFMRIPIVARQSGLNVKQFFKDVIAKEIIAAVICAATCILCVSLMSFKWRFIVTLICSALVYSVCMYFIGLTKKEREIVLGLKDSLLAKIRKK